jgi:FkbM family methyltransferase
MINKISKVSNFVDTTRKLFGYRFPRLGKCINRLFFALVPSSISVELFPKIKLNLNLNDATQRTTYWQGSRFEFPTPKVLASWGKNAEIFFDIGANYGFYSYWMLYSCPNILVYSFEPNPKTYAILKDAKQNNDLSRLRVFQTGLGKDAGMFDLHPGIEDMGHSTFLPHPDFVHSTIARIPILPFDKWREQIKLVLPKKPEWIAKIDVEGLEFKVLEGMEKALSAQAFKGISIEILEHTLALCGDSPQNIFSFLESHNYKPISKVNSRTANVFFVPRSVNA